MLDDVAVLEHDANLSVAYLCALAAKIGVCESLPAGTIVLVACLFRHEPRSGDPFFWPQTLQAAPQKAPPPITSFGSDQ